ncbi:MAG: 50S ribosomal protein L29 [Anaerolineaceae bacterium]|nr:50S ribosomal protein L29 [Anaerolineaceae bacterium]
MHISEIRAMDREAILDTIEDLKATHFRLRLEKASGQLANPNVVRETKRDIARCLTVLRERELAADMAGEDSDDA